MKTADRSVQTLGAIEGLPLQMMIVILVATMCTAIIVGWMGSIDSPDVIGELVYEDTIVADGSSLGDVEITVMDTEGNLVEGATVILSGLNVQMDGGTAYAVTDANGVASFSGLTINASGSSSYGLISIDVSKSGYTYGGNYEIMVIL